MTETSDFLLGYERWRKLVREGEGDLALGGVVTAAVTTFLVLYVMVDLDCRRIAKSYLEEYLRTQKKIVHHRGGVCIDAQQRAWKTNIGKMKKLARHTQYEHHVLCWWCGSRW